MRILFAEDSVQLASMVTELLMKKFDTDIKIDWRLDGAPAFEEFKKRNYDLVITDLHMPNKDGVWLAGKIRETNKSIPIILWTSDTTSYRHEGLVDEIILKDFRELLNSVGELYEQKKKGKDNV